MISLPSVYCNIYIYIYVYIINVRDREFPDEPYCFVNLKIASSLFAIFSGAAWEASSDSQNCKIASRYALASDTFDDYPVPPLPVYQSLPLLAGACFSLLVGVGYAM